ncbi:DMT family transporter [Alicyclobacillus sendaiensis]|uniref:DMT family transporter n=1 Tax=Alicyclobacillus sendaiensis PA2 TaxID=3029425 RepID=A0ABT6Y179_ALISE|nr:DMT family transporter [Alicyclobacillus sendaiensis]MDI9261098.1 DMT family transporter [Alicyclobacillus sendaiensis PA2]
MDNVLEGFQNSICEWIDDRVLESLSDTTGTWAAVCAGLIFGANSIVVKYANIYGVSVPLLAFYQYFFALIYFGLKLFRQRIPGTSLLLRNPFNWVAGVAGASTGLFYYCSIRMTTPSVAALGLFQYPWIIFLLGLIFGHQRFLRKYIFNVLALWIGTLLLIGTKLNNEPVLGMLCGFIAGVSFAIYLFSLQYVSKHRSTQLFIIAISALIAFSVSFTQLHAWHSIFAWQNIIFGLVTSLMGQIVTFELLIFAGKRLHSTLLGTLTTTELPSAMILSWLIWGPPPSLLQICGLIIMVLAIVWMKFAEGS